MDSQNKEKKSNNATDVSVRSKEKPSFWHIDRDMLRFKIHFFLLNGALGASIPYVSVIARNRIGFAATSMAALIVAQRFLYIITKTVIGYLADYFKKLKAIICVLVVLQALFYFLILTVPHVKSLSYIFELEVFLGNSNISVSPKNCRDSDFDEHLLTEFRKLKNINGKFMFCEITTEGNPFIGRSTNYTDYGKMLEYITNNDTKMRNICNETFSEKLISRGAYALSFIENFHLVNDSSNTISSSVCTFCPSSAECCHSACRKTTDTEHKSGDDDFKTFQFWIYALFSTIAGGSINALFTLSDTACCETVQKTGADFGRQRMWSAIGWGVMSLVGGFLNDFTNDYVASFTFASVLSLLTLWNLAKLDMLQPHFSKNIAKDVGIVFRSSEFLAFEAGVLLHGVCMGFIWFNLTWFLTEIGGSRFLCGMVQFMNCIIGDIPFMFFSGWLLNKLGHFNVLSLAMMTYLIRFIAYSQIENPWYIVPFECLHGLTYGAFMPAVANYAKIQAKPGTEATTQAILFATHEGLGAGIGGVLAGMGFDNLGGHQTYLYASILAGGSVAASIIFTLCIQLRRRNFKVTSSTKFPVPTP